MRLLTFALLTFIPFLSFAQTDTTKIDQFCEMVAQGKLFSNKITIDLDFGEGKSLFSFKDTRLKDELTQKVKKFRSTVDALNYMGAKGWRLLNAFAVSEGSQNVYHFFFVKTFDKSLFILNENQND